MGQVTILGEVAFFTKWNQTRVIDSKHLLDAKISRARF